MTSSHKNGPGALRKVLLCFLFVFQKLSLVTNSLIRRVIYFLVSMLRYEKVPRLGKGGGGGGRVVVLQSSAKSKKGSLTTLT